MDTVKRGKKWPSKEMLALCCAFAWLVFITLCHYLLSSNNYEEDHIRVGFLPITCHLLLPVTLARDDFLKDRVEPVKYSSWPDMIESVKGGELDAALILAPIALRLMAQNVPVKIALLGHREGTALVVSNKSNIKTPKDLRGKTVAIPIRFSTQNLSLLGLLEKHHITKNELDIVELPPPDMPSALASGSIDAYIVGEPYATQAEMVGKGHIFRRSRQLWPKFISSLLIIRTDSLKKKRALMNRFIKGLFDQASWVEKNRKEAADITAEFFGLRKELIEAVLLNKEVYYTDLVPEKSELEYIARLMVHFGLMKKQPPCHIYEGWQ